MHTISLHRHKTREQHQKQKQKQKVQMSMTAKHDIITAVGTGAIALATKEAMHSIKSDLTLNEVDKVSQRMIKKHNLDKTGFKHIYVDNKNLIQTVDKTAKRLKKSAASKKIKRASLASIKSTLFHVINTIKRGENASFIPDANIAISSKEKPYTMPHEIGHAINSNFSKLTKNLVKHARKLPKIATPILFFNAVSNDLNKKDDSITKKVRNFLEENATKLTLLSFAPMVAEEGLASAHGLKHAKKVLGNKKLGTFLKSYSVGFASYAAAAATAAIAMHSAMQEKKKLPQSN